MKEFNLYVGDVVRLNNGAVGIIDNIYYLISDDDDERDELIKLRDGVDEAYVIEFSIIPNTYEVPTAWYTLGDIKERLMCAIDYIEEYAPPADEDEDESDEEDEGAE